MPPDPPPPTPPFEFDPVPPDLLEYARQTFDLADFLRDLDEIKATGGHTFEEVIAAVEAAVRGES